MVPDTVIGVLLSIVLLAPGFVYLETRERHHPGIKYSPIRETSFVVTTSLSTLSLGALLFAVVRVIAPEATPDIGAYVRHGGSEFRAHYVQAAAWGLGLVAFACVLASLSAIPPRWCAAWTRGLPVVGERCSTWLSQRRGNGPIRAQSGWGLAMTLLPNTQQWVDIVLLDGTCLHGMLMAHSTQIEETADRDLVIATPIRARPPLATDWTTLTAGTLVVSGARISYFTVQYVQVSSVDVANATSTGPAIDGPNSGSE